MLLKPVKSGYINAIVHGLIITIMRVLHMFSIPKGLMVVSIVKISQEIKSEFLTSLSVAVFSKGNI